VVGIIHRNRGSVFFASILVLIVALSTATGIAASQSAPDCSTVSYNGDGTTSNPYEVGNVDQLQCIEEQDLGANYVQVSDIDASSTSGWNDGAGFEPIGEFNRTRDTEFNGTFDGKSYNILDLHIDRGSTFNIGLFGVVDPGGRIENASLENVDITGSADFGRVGALVADNRGNITESYATGSVSGDDVVGGLVGINTGGTVLESYATGSVSGTDFVGGLVGGNVDGGTVRESYATGDVSGTDFVGGLVGRNTGIVTDSYATGDVSGNDIVGGLVGNNFDRYRVGTVEKSYATGDVSGTDFVGGLVGKNGATVTESYWDTETTGRATSDGGTGLTTSQMTGSAAKSNMQGFDFTSAWETVPDDYPILAWQKESSEGSDDGSDSSFGNDDGGIQGLPGFTTITALLALLTVVAAAVRRRTK
jgi:hypothetical protein